MTLKSFEALSQVPEVRKELAIAAVRRKLYELVVKVGLPASALAVQVSKLPSEVIHDPVVQSLLWLAS